MALLVNQSRRKKATTRATRRESLVKYVALYFAVVSSLPGVVMHLLEELMVWLLDTAVDCTGKGHRPYDKYSYRAATQLWRLVSEDLAHVVSVAREGDASGANSALRAHTTLFAPVWSAAGAGEAASPSGAPTIR